MYIIAHCSSHLNRNQPSQTHTPISTVGILTMCRIAISTTSSFPGLLYLLCTTARDTVFPQCAFWRNGETVYCLHQRTRLPCAVQQSVLISERPLFGLLKLQLHFLLFCALDRDPSYFLSILSSSAHYSRRLHSEISCAQMQFSKHILDQNHCTLLASEQGDAIQIKPFVLDFGVHNCKVPSLPLEYECISSYRLLN